MIQTVEGSGYERLNEHSKSKSVNNNGLAWKPVRTLILNVEIGFKIEKGDSEGSFMAASKR